MKDSKEIIDSGVLSHRELEKSFSFNSVKHLVEIIKNIDLEVQSGDIVFNNDSSYLCFNSTNKKELIKTLNNMNRSELSIDKD